MSFSRRRRADPREPDLDVLLALASASQATSATARAQARVGDPERADAAGSDRLRLFCGTDEGNVAARLHCFAVVPPVAATSDRES